MNNIHMFIQVNINKMLFLEINLFKPLGIRLESRVIHLYSGLLFVSKIFFHPFFEHNQMISL